MNAVIEWLFQRTIDGSTHLQVIIIGAFLIIIFNLIFKSIEDIMNCTKDETKKEESDNV